MTCINIVDNRNRCSTNSCDAVVEMLPTPNKMIDLEIHAVKVLKDTTVERVIKFAQRVKHPVVVFLYTAGQFNTD